MVKLTENQTLVLKYMYQSGLDAMGGTTADHLKDDNMSLVFPSELAEALGKSRQSIGGILAGLAKRGYITRGDKRTKRQGFDVEQFAGQYEWWLDTNAGIEVAASL
jgi:DNA-binding MarR family transcriptional regulator